MANIAGEDEEWGGFMGLEEFGDFGGREMDVASVGWEGEAFFVLVVSIWEIKLQDLLRGYRGRESANG